MNYTTLGQTNLNVSVMGIGAGGPSKLGLRQGKTDADSVNIIHQALDAGVNFIDTAESYKTESIVGQAIQHVERDQVIISTKKTCTDEMTPQQTRESLEASLSKLGTDYIDIYNLHAVTNSQYDPLSQEIVPVLLKLQGEGKIRFLGITEEFNSDLEHLMLQRALDDGIWDVIMVGFNILHQTARETIFPQTISQNIGTQIMFAVRAALSKPDRLREAVQKLIALEQLDPSEIDIENPLDFLVTEGHAESITDAAYRFCRDEPGAQVILSGTGNPEHLKANIESLNRPPLSPEITQKLRHIFRNAHGVTGQ